MIDVFPWLVALSFPMATAAAAGQAAQPPADTWNAYWHNRAGIRHLQDKALFPAYQDFLKALEYDPLSPRVQMNLGLILELNEEYPKAEQAYRGVLKLVPEDSPLRFEAKFNLAGVLAKEGKIDEALSAYQECLDAAPDSAEVKTNIELLWKGGKGGGKSDSKKDQSKSEQPKNRDQQRGDQPEQKPQPKPFNSQELSPEDMKRILDEIKNQEQSIRANEYEKGAKEAPRDKDW